jgi:hypothetical protein
MMASSLPHRNSKEDEALIRFIEDTIAQSRSGILDAEACLGSIAIVLSAWVTGRPAIRRHIKAENR